MSTSMSEKPRQPWYRQGWPWFLIAFPAAAVVGGIATLVIAVQSFDGMVVDDYYKEGRAIVQTIGRVEHARELGLRAQLRVRSESVHIELSAADAVRLPERIRLTVAHPTRGGLDQELVLAGSAGVYEAALAPLGTGRWLFVIEDEARSWRMDGSAFLPAEMEITIDPNV
ncbi:FixH family protein [Thauera sp. GDN1]|uniref:FixH family protein n=1 Tax=Thauera sp. GDN1 TaxID=2944810 RepID=UPI002479C458|nr:FixH family protein [Thauera sp. GDN1]